MSVELCRSRMFESECCNCWVTGYRYVINEVIKWKPTYTRTQIALGNITETTGERQQQVQKNPQYKLCQFGQEAVVRVCSINTTYWVNTHSSHGANTLCFVYIFRWTESRLWSEHYHPHRVPCCFNCAVSPVCPAVSLRNRSAHKEPENGSASFAYVNQRHREPQHRTRAAPALRPGLLREAYSGSVVVGEVGCVITSLFTAIFSQCTGQKWKRITQILKYSSVPTMPCTGRM